MKKFVALLAAMMLLCTCALAEEIAAEENAYLSREEITMYLDTLTSDALALGVTASATHEEDGTTAVTYGNGAVLLIAEEQLTQSSAVLGASLGLEQEDLRGIYVGSSLQDVMAVYPNDNPDLFGTQYDAILYVNDERPEAAVGYVLRDGQRVTNVVHQVFTWQNDAVYLTSVNYAVENGVVGGIDITGLDRPIDEAEALQQIADAAAAQENKEYFAYPSSAKGSDMAPFGTEDLVFSNLDFEHLTPDSAKAALGEPQVNNDWIQDDNGEQLLTMQWDGVSIVFRCDENKNVVGVDSLTVNDDVIEGPRGVRIGDTVESVMNRFRHGDDETWTDGMMLYGDGDNAPFGVYAQGQHTVTLTYAVATSDGKSVLWQDIFADGLLESYRMLLR